MSIKRRRTQAETTKPEEEVKVEVSAEASEAEESQATVTEEKVELPEETVDAGVSVAEDYEAPTVQTPETPVSASPAVKEIEQPAPAPKVEAPADQTAAHLLVELDSYADTVRPGAVVSDQEGAAQQTRLYRLFDRVINRVPEEKFDVAMGALLDWVTAHRDGVMSDGYRNRWAASLAMTAEEIQFFHRIGSFLYLYTDKKVRNTILKEMSIDYYVEVGFTDAGRQRFLGYFGF